MIRESSQNDRRDHERMVKDQIERRGVRDKRVLDAMRKVPRELFVERHDREFAFHDGPLSIGHGQTISQPYIVAYMTEALAIGSTDRVLEIGTGSGYQTAVLAELAAEVYTIEIVEELSARAQKVLGELGYSNIHFRAGDGSLGWPEAVPFNAIMVTAAPDRTPERFLEQLAEGGRMIVPVGSGEQYLELLTRRGGAVERRELIGVRFVPMTGRIQKGEA
ncbi:MAG: protein-L-isoaspartate(D-aspartate) O-methyltransferase [Candidatus Krumholzibacteria bacterium]|nr:protein-L-isoaspartate(D-aspartate) O-methyltransferase [Candidatus Krumholzibacteria bacterium]